MEWKDALYLYKDETIINSWVGDHEWTYVRKGRRPTKITNKENGVLVLTNKRLIFLEEKGMFSKSYRLKLSIWLSKINAISMGGILRKYVSISSDINQENSFHVAGIGNESELELFRQKIDHYKIEKRGKSEKIPSIVAQPIATMTTSQRTAVPLDDDNFQKGFAFEEYFISLFDKYPFRLWYRTKDKPFKADVHTESDNLPDLTFRNIETNQKIFIEAKFRSNLVDNYLYVAKPDSLERYKTYSRNENAPCFIVVGLGGLPNNPNRMFLLPLNEIRGAYLSPSVFQKYERNPTKSFSWDEFECIPIKNGGK